MQDDPACDSIKGIFIKECAVISKLATGIGASVHDIHAAGIYICGTDGTSNSIVPIAEFPVT